MNGGAEIILVVVNFSIVEVLVAKKKQIILKIKKTKRAKKRQEKRLLEERAKRDKRIAALDRELEKLRKENRELNVWL